VKRALVVDNQLERHQARGVRHFDGSFGQDRAYRHVQSFRIMLDEQ